MRKPRNVGGPPSEVRARSRPARLAANAGWGRPRATRRPVAQMALRPLTAVYWALRGASALARVVPVRVSYALARASGTLVYYAWAGGRRRSIGNMLHVARG